MNCGQFSRDGEFRLVYPYSMVAVKRKEARQALRQCQKEAAVVTA
jgi:hypothetical protein